MLDDDLKRWSWRLFSTTGQIGYYMLYKRLSDPSDSDDVNPPDREL